MKINIESYYITIEELAKEVKILDKNIPLEEMNSGDGIYSVPGDSNETYFIRKGIRTPFDDYTLNGTILEGEKKVYEANIFDILLCVRKDLETGEKSHGFVIKFYEVIKNVPEDDNYKPWVVTDYNSRVYGNFANLEEVKEYAKRVLENI